MDCTSVEEKKKVQFHRVECIETIETIETIEKKKGGRKLWKDLKSACDQKKKRRRRRQGNQLERVRLV